MDPVTEEQVAAAIRAWKLSHKGKMPNTTQVTEIYNKLVETARAATEGDPKAKKEKDSQPLTDEGIKTLTGTLVNPGGTPAVAAMQAMPRKLTGGVEATIDPLTGKQYENITTSRGNRFHSIESGLDASYSGLNLVDENGRITASTLTNNDGGAEANVLFQKFVGNGTLPQFLQQIKDHNHYGKNNISAIAIAGQGLTATDYTAIDSFINSANLSRLTPMAYLKTMNALPPVASPGSGSSIAFPNQLDVNRTVRDEFFSAVGRAPTLAEIKMAAQYIKQSYMAAGGTGGEQAPSLASAGGMAVAKQTGQEGAVYSLGLALNRMFQTKGSA